ncbi:uncharacterized protein [Nicotiana sylvestris]|uniref:uncharacterized protein n=1 Tax=Nicotiana sylvestris TaxID=4096 RepID=UPI00388CAE02
MARKIKSLEQSLKNMQGPSGQKSVSYSDLCIFPRVHLPDGFMMPKFEKYNGHGDPVAHLKRYYNQFRGFGGNEELLMAYFGESLIGIASEWYINSLSNLKKKYAKRFREYAVKWREQAATVKPPMDEIEMVTVFLQAQKVDYFYNIMSAMGKPFAEPIKIGEMVESGLKTSRILSHGAFKAISPDVQNGSERLINGNRREEGAMMASSSRGACRSLNQSYILPEVPQHYYPLSDAAYAVA